MFGPKAPSPYPGHDSTGEYNTPRKPPKLRGSGEEFARKNAGSINLFNDEKNSHVGYDPPPDPKCLSQEAKDNYQRGRHGNVGGLLGGGGALPPAEPTAAPR